DHSRAHRGAHAAGRGLDRRGRHRGGQGGRGRPGPHRRRGTGAAGCVPGPGLVRHDCLTPWIARARFALTQRRSWMVSVAGPRADSAPTDKSPTGEPPTGEPPTSDSPTGESPAGGSPAGDSPAGGTGGRADGSGAVHAQVRRLAGRYWFLLPIAVLVSSVLLAVQILDSRPEPAPVALVDCETERPDDYECWRDRLRTLVARDSPQAALADVRAVYDRVPFVADQCHQLVHEIGRAAGQRYGDVAEAYAVGDDLCASGYFHGVLEAVTEQIGLETLITEIDTVCGPLKERDPYSLDHYNCVHGLGHGLMGVTYSQLYESLAACDAYSEAWERESCYGGVFMENIMARDNPHHPSIY